MHILTDANPPARTLKQSACAALFAVLQVNDGQAAVDVGEFVGCNMAHRRATRSSAWLTVERHTQLRACDRTLSSAEAV
jgi:hypothetical protein